jgi:hypothetical protein
MQATTHQNFYFADSVSLTKDTKINSIIEGPDHRRYVYVSTKESFDTSKNLYKILKFIVDFLKHFPFTTTLTKKIEEYNHSHFRTKIVHHCTVLDPTETIDHRFDYSAFCKTHGKDALSRCTGAQLVHAQKGFLEHLITIGTVKVLENPNPYFKDGEILDIKPDQITSYLIELINNEFTFSPWREFISLNGLESLKYVTDEKKKKKTDQLINKLDDKIKNEGLNALCLEESFIEQLDDFGLIETFKCKINDYMKNTPLEVLLKEKAIDNLKQLSKVLIKQNDSSSPKEIIWIDDVKTKCLEEFRSQFLDLEKERASNHANLEKEHKELLDNALSSKKEYLAELKQELGMPDFDEIKKKVKDAKEKIAKYQENNRQEEEADKLQDIQFNEIQNKIGNLSNKRNELFKIQSRASQKMMKIASSNNVNDELKAKNEFENITPQLLEINNQIVELERKRSNCIHYRLNKPAAINSYPMDAQIILLENELILNEYIAKFKPVKELNMVEYKPYIAKLANEKEEFKTAINAEFAEKKAALITLWASQFK